MMIHLLSDTYQQNAVNIQALHYFQQHSYSSQMYRMHTKHHTHTY
jgi:hypothetical protein